MTDDNLVLDEQKYDVIALGKGDLNVSTLTRSEISKLSWWCNNIHWRLMQGKPCILTSEMFSDVIIVKVHS